MSYKTVFKKFMLQILSLFLSAFLFSCAQTYDNTFESREDELQSIPLELTTDKGGQDTFVEGEEVQWLLSLGSDAYIYMYHIETSGNVIQLVPNKDQQSNYYTASYFLTIPEYGDGYRFIIQKPFGIETMWVIASDELITRQELQGSMEDIRQKIKSASRRAYGEVSFTISKKKK